MDEGDQVGAVLLDRVEPLRVGADPAHLGFDPERLRADPFDTRGHALSEDSLDPDQRAVAWLQQVDEVGFHACAASARNRQSQRMIRSEHLPQHFLHVVQDFEKCRDLVEKLDLAMELADIEHVFGGERIIVYYLSEDRVDFRELVKQLAAEFQTRIEMRQIGVRDEAKLLADYGDCGKPVCCNTHLSLMPPVSMKMAKIQKATLDPTKISGRCGRLKCCLRYEFETYEELRDELPPIGVEVITSSGRGKVLRHEILSQQVLVEMEDHRRRIVARQDILTVLEKKGGRGGR